MQPWRVLVCGERSEPTCIKTSTANCQRRKNIVSLKYFTSVFQNVKSVCGIREIYSNYAQTNSHLTLRKSKKRA